MSARRCDNCGRPFDGQPYRIRVGDRLALVCGCCLERLVRGIVSVERAVRRRAA